MKYFPLSFRFRISLTLLAISTACSPADSKKKPAYGNLGGADSTAVVQNPKQYLGLQNFENCSVADSYVQSNLRRILKDQFDQQRKHLIQWDQSVQYDYSPVAGKASANTTNDTAAESGEAPADFTKTNTQVANVDEPDRMKTNGTHIFTISGHELQIVQSWPANEMKLIKTIKIDGSPQKLFLTEDKKLVLVSHPRVKTEEASFRGGKRAPWYFDEQIDWSVVRLEIYDIAQVATPVLSKTFHFRGNYLDMRRQGQIVRLISSSAYPSFPSGIQSGIPIYENDKVISLEAFDRIRAQFDKGNEEILSKLTLASYISQQNQYEGYSAWKGTTDDLLDKPGLDCSQVFASEAVKEFGLTTVTSLNLKDGQISQSALLSPANSIYASEQSLYLTYGYRAWWFGSEVQDGSKLFIHKFAYESKDSTKVSYEGSGALDGFLNNQFSLDEYEGHLRVAITDDRIPVAGKSKEGPEFTTANRIVVMKPIAKKLEIVGKTPDLAPGERIYSARFNGKKGYVVTFRETDPLYTLDLTDPASPKVTGELKVNGYSSYIHMIDDNTLLTVGQDADPKNGQVLGLKIAVFDVTNPSLPIEKFTKLLSDDSEYSWSDSEYDHHAFTYFASRGLLGIPVGGYRKNNRNARDWWDSYYSELRVFKIDLEKGISNVGAIGMNDLYQAERLEWSNWWDGSQVQRSVFADDFVYAISSAGIKAVKTGAMNVPLSSVRFYP